MSALRLSFLSLFLYPSLFRALFLLPPNFRIFVWLYLNKSQILAKSSRYRSEQGIATTTLARTAWTIDYWRRSLCVFLFVLSRSLALRSQLFDFCIGPRENCNCKLQSWLCSPAKLHIFSSDFFRISSNPICYCQWIWLSFFRRNLFFARNFQFQYKTIGEAKERERERTEGEIACEFIVSLLNDRTCTYTNTHTAPHTFNHWQRFEYLLFWQSEQLISA